MIDKVHLKQDNKEAILDLRKKELEAWEFLKFAKKEKNEKGFETGRFGWCLICRKGADFYCKEQ